MRWKCQVEDNLFIFQKRTQFTKKKMIPVCTGLSTEVGRGRCGWSEAVWAADGGSMSRQIDHRTVPISPRPSYNMYIQKIYCYLDVNSQNIMWCKNYTKVTRISAAVYPCPMWSVVTFLHFSLLDVWWPFSTYVHLMCGQCDTRSPFCTQAYLMHGPILCVVTFLHLNLFDEMLCHEISFMKWHVMKCHIL